MRTKALIMIGTAALLAVSFAPPAHATHYGSLKLTGPAPGLVARYPTITWTVRYGTKVRSSSLVDLRAYPLDPPGGPSSSIARSVPVSSGRATWNTRRVPDGTYSIAGTVVGTTIRSRLGNYTVDNTAPTIAITRPQAGQIIVNDAVIIEGLPLTLVAGPVTFESAASDAGSGISKIRWAIDGQTRRGPRATYDFSGDPGEHVVTVYATDLARNVSAVQGITFTAVPDPASLVPEPPPAHEPIDTVSVDSANPAGATSTAVLQAGTEYTVVAKGTYLFSATAQPTAVADAECSAAIQQGAPYATNHWGGMTPEVDDPLDLLVAGAEVSWMPTVGTGVGCNEATNEYTLSYTPSVTGPVSFRVYDHSGYADNFGTLTVEIYDETPQLVAAVEAPAPLPAALGGQALGAGIGVAVRRRVLRRARRNTGRGRR